MEEYLKAWLSYDPVSGLVRNRKGRPLGSPDGRGYLRIGTRKYGHFQAHRIAWLLHYGTWPVGEINHINGVRTDNRIENLEDVSHSLNMRSHYDLVKYDNQNIYQRQTKYGKIRFRVYIQGVTSKTFSTVEKARKWRDTCKPWRIST